MVLVVFSQTGSSSILIQCPSVLLQGAVLIWEGWVVEVRTDETKWEVLRGL